DILRLFHHRGGEFARLGELANIDERRVRECRDWVKGEIAPRLQPNLRTDVLQHARLESCLDEDVVQLLRALRLPPVELADRKTITFDVVDHAGRSHSRCRINYAADDTVCVYPLRENARRIEAHEALIVVAATEALEIPPGEPVLNREYDRIWPKQLIDLTDDLVKVVRLHGEHDDILFAGLRRLLNGSHLRRFYLAVVPFKLEAVLLHRGKMRALVDDGHLVAGERELGGHQSADGAGADDADLLRFGQR